MKTVRVLFICTGNIYRSRYAEAYTNHLAGTEGLPIEATSRGLAVHLVDIDTSPHVVERLSLKGIPSSCTGANKKPLHEDDLRDAEVIVALKEDEHRPMMERQFPSWADRITYWHVSDAGEWHPDKALERIENEVSALCNEIGREL